MRICYVAFQFWPSVGGAQTQAEKQARCLRQSGQEVMVVTLRHQKTWPAREFYAGVPIRRVGGWYRRGGTLRAGKLGHLFIDVRMFLTLWRLRRTYDLIHLFQLSPLAFVATVIGKITGKPVIIGIQSTGPCELDLPSQDGQVSHVPERETPAAQALPDSQGAVGGDIALLRQTAWGGEWMLNYLRKSNAYCQILSSRSYLYVMQHGFRPERILYIPTGVDVQQFYPGRWAWPEAMAQSEERHIVCVARLEYAKGVDVLLRAWAQMLAMPADWRRGFRLRLFLAGDGTCRAELEALADELNVRESVEFLGTCHDVPRLLQDSWGFVLPSRWEGMPNALLEAMACALPCVATRVSGSEDVIEQGSNGLLVEPDRPQQLAYALRLVIEDHQLAGQLSRRGYETILRYYQLDSAVQNLLTFYAYLLARGSSQRSSPGSLQSDDLSPEEWQRYGQ
jgi:glycosyltransferase involved in cell wall biosynthesis